MEIYWNLNDTIAIAKEINEFEDGYDMIGKKIFFNYPESSARLIMRASWYYYGRKPIFYKVVNFENFKWDISDPLYDERFYSKCEYALDSYELVGDSSYLRSQYCEFEKDDFLKFRYFAYIESFENAELMVDSLVRKNPNYAKKIKHF